MLPAKTGSPAVAEKAIAHFADVLHPLAVRIFTPFQKSVPLSKCGLKPALGRFIGNYEPKTLEAGVFPHQARFFTALAKGSPSDNFIITTATGSGKSLCFWTWVIDRLLRDSTATALLCFPTQALMWGQAERLARMSAEESLSFPGGRDATAFAGSISVGGRRIDWTVWHGVGSGYTRNHAMAEHEQSESFLGARIRIATLDKAHWSLHATRQGKEFLANLRCLVLDEAHIYDGVFGANVHYFLKRLYLGRNILGQEAPGIFLASATLSSARSFAKTLLSLSAEESITHIPDTTSQQIDLIPVGEVVKELSEPPSDGLLRIALLLNGRNKEVRLLPFMSGDKFLGTDANAIYFSESKYQSKRLAMEMAKWGGKRDMVIYDADLPPRRRRSLEKTLNDPKVKGTTVLATSAMELGVDIEGLDVCLIEEVPPGRADMLQRIGRVGRRAGRPGLIIMRLSSEPKDQHIIEDPEKAFRLDSSRPVPIPLHLEMLKWRSMLAAFSEWQYSLRYGSVSWPVFNRALVKHYGEKHYYPDLKAGFEERYGTLVDTRDSAWVHKGFRASASEGKLPLLHGHEEVARVEDIALFRDAHPEAVFLGHDLRRYRIISYEGQWKVARWQHPDSDEVLGKWLKTISAVRVAPEQRRVVTRGTWEEYFELYECVTELPPHLKTPTRGACEFGIWDYTRKWQGYKEIDLDTGEVTRVPLAEVSRRFKQAVEQGSRFPYLFPYSYRTWGWQWNFGGWRRTAADTDGSLGAITASLLRHFLAAALESRAEDIHLNLNVPGTTLQVLDHTPGGNGLSEALLTNGRMASALDSCARALGRFCARPPHDFEEYTVELCRTSTVHSPEEVLDVVRRLQVCWAG